MKIRFYPSAHQPPVWLLVIGCLICTTPVVGRQQAEQQQELEQVQQQIKTTERQLKKQQQQLSKAEQLLQQSDRALANASAELRQTEQQLARIEQSGQELNQQQLQLQTELQQQQTQLAAQLKSAYSLGQHDYTRMLLNQQDAGKLERALTYYQYFNRARVKQLAEINKTVLQLEQVKKQLAEQQQQLQTTLTEQQQQQQQLLAVKAEQQTAVSQLQQLLKEQGNQLSYLRQNESSLQTTIDQLRALAERSLELLGLTANKGKLRWPLNGALLQGFGENRQGGMRSRGILIGGTEGNPVQAIADGRVIYADWLKGYGWVIVLDHGEGFMSLYGHNQNILKQPGEQIIAGETIALVGMSGGQANAGLYFEIREKGDAVNPLAWLSKNKG
ncbi:Septal ring factor EnvC, activator of murein hydrolases AmiA and AmiB [Arsukibacterium tuosuense]|uniref:Septal ring factor EnvC, activator of murein hydrolases AmiA and AmiB n=1 Tax=Arsukibacterium tuosuense TaxID=1323745 RepID=A0A285JAR7_9GAMM|nr:peptidoglycan DD-metalloendopeptidase family protein [Arsukibacterium tuosuense]SNY57380.1 Septal ring factor EnvC, activator of murein hydrolases AmiA and AmiB [Arsukibacterium tuosuense]